jgi:hypothetical protein
MPYVATFQIADGLAQANGGCLRGMGRQHIGAAVNLVAYYCMALPCGIYLAFHGWGLAGLWAGNSGGILQLFRANYSAFHCRDIRVGDCIFYKLAEAGPCCLREVNVIEMRLNDRMEEDSRAEEAFALPACE